MFEKLPTCASELKADILSECITSLKLKTLTDNFDKERFNYDGVDRANVFHVSDRVFWFSWFFENIENLFDVFNTLSSDNSKHRFLSIIAYRLAGHHSIRINTSFTEEGEVYQNYQKLESGSPSQLKAKGMFGTLKHLDFEYNSKRYVIDCLGLKYYLLRRQYFFDEHGVQIQPDTGDFVVDAGAFLGDSAVVFGKAVGPQGKVYAFDPVEDHLEVIRFNAAQNPDCDITAFPYGLADQDIDCAPIQMGQYAPGFNSQNTPVPLRTLDTLVMDGQIKRIDFIKMDIEGAELAALKGATGCIRKFRPKLAISLYHKPNDLFEIPAYIKATFPFYEMLMGHYTIHNEETVLYCRPI